MSEELERSIRTKIMDLQIFLSSSRVTDESLAEIDVKLDLVLEIVNPKTGGSKCEA